jgi:hypothetical protein
MSALFRFPHQFTQPNKILVCVGCGLKREWSGRGVLAITCICRATFFMEETENKLMPPASFYMRVMLAGRKYTDSIPHIDYYVGISNHHSNMKDEIVLMLKQKGSKWSWNCDRCKDEVIKHIKWEMERCYIRFELNSELAKLVQ